MICSSVFFFQAEDGIRDLTVTGVQTCALPISVTHVDGSGRLQTVHRETNPRYYALIESFRKLTGVPMVLNTSFNENEPVVCRPEEALDCFLRTKMDMLVLDDFIVTRGSSVAP